MTTPEWHTVDQNLNGEIWKVCPGFPDYAVSSKGRVLSRAKISKRKSHGGKTAGFATVGKLLKLQAGAHGYLKVNLGYTKQRMVHGLVARAFLGVRPEGAQVNHKNGKKADNRVENLEYCTPKENIAHALETGLRKGKLTEEQKVEIRARYLKGESCLEMAKDYNVHNSSLAAVCRELDKPQTIRARLKTSKLTVQQIRQIKTRLAAGQTLSSIARDFSVSRTTVSYIKTGKTWSGV